MTEPGLAAALGDVVRDRRVDVVVTDPGDLATGTLPVTVDEDRPAAGDLDADRLLDLLDAHRGEAPEARTPAPDDPALLSYTSGTTGPPKGAINTHGNIAFSAEVYAAWIGLGPEDVCLGMAPLFHITGAVGHLAASLVTGMPLVLGYRFDAGETLRLVERHRCTLAWRRSRRSSR